MTRKLLLSVFAMLLLSAFAAAESWDNVALVDNHCVNQVKANPDVHTRDCLLKCERAGYGIVTSDGNYLKLDANGNAEAAKLLKNSDKKDHVRVSVTGERQGDTIKVQSIKM